jgi:hypothetical protein
MRYFQDIMTYGHLNHINSFVLSYAVLGDYELNLARKMIVFRPHDSPYIEKTHVVEFLWRGTQNNTPVRARKKM